VSGSSPDVEALIAQARAEARDEVLARLRARFVDELLEKAEAALAEGSRPGVSLIGVVPATSALDGVSCGRVKALVSEFDARELDDPQALERRVRAHNDVLLRAHAEASVVPIRFGTVFADASDVTAWLARNEAALVEELDRLEGAVEWALTVTQREPLEPELVATVGYLERRVAEGEEAARRMRLLAERAATWHESLAERAEAARRNSAHGTPLDAAYLVRSEQQGAFDAAVLELQDDLGDDFELRLTGPWPPLSFVSADLH